MSLLDADADLTSGRGLSPVAKAMIGLGVCTILLAGLAAGALVMVVSRFDGQLARIPGALPAAPAESGEPGAAEHDRALNILLLGTDLRPDQSLPAQGWVPGLQRSDTMMVLHVDADRRGAALISIPRDSWVDIPGHGMGKINAAFSYAGPALAVQTVQELTGLHIDHLLAIDWAGFERLTDDLGGVTVQVAETVHDSYNNLTWQAGDHLLQGPSAMLYIRQRAGLAGGDLTRVQRQQNFLRAVMRQVHETFRGKDPRQIYALLDRLTASAAVDDGWDTLEMQRLALDLFELREGDIRFLTVPVAGLGREGLQSVVHLDHRRGRALWRAVDQDRVEQWVQRNQSALTPEVVG